MLLLYRARKLIRVKIVKISEDCGTAKALMIIRTSKDFGAMPLMLFKMSKELQSNSVYTAKDTIAGKNEEGIVDTKRLQSRESTDAEPEIHDGGNTLECEVRKNSKTERGRKGEELQDLCLCMLKCASQKWVPQVHLSQPQKSDLGCFITSE